jgi:hypothetical protein
LDERQAAPTRRTALTFAISGPELTLRKRRRRPQKPLHMAIGWAAIDADWRFFALCVKGQKC